MTDRALAAALLEATNWETVVRQHWDVSIEGPEKIAARDLLRHTVQFRVALERFVGTRVVRAHLQKTG